MTFRFLFILFLNLELLYAQDMIFRAEDTAESVWPTSGVNDGQDPMNDGYGPRLLSGEYDYHRGLDFPKSTGAPVYAPLPGVVVRVREYVDSGPNATISLRRYGNFIVVAHNSIVDKKGNTRKRQTAYLHLDGFNVEEGDTVYPGDIIGFVGNSGENINTEHLHFEYHIGRNDGLISSSNTRNPFRLFNYEYHKPVVSLRVTEGTIYLEMSFFKSSLDLTRFRLKTDTGVEKVIDFETREGIASDEDDNSHDGVLILPEYFNRNSDSMVLKIEYDKILNSLKPWTDVSEAVITLYNTRDDSTDYVFTLTGVEETASVVPPNPMLYRNYPNPFNPVTGIRYYIPPNGTEAESVAINVYTLTGEKAATLFKGKVSAGEHSVEFDGSAFPSGVYIYTLETPRQVISKKMILLK